MAYCTEQEIINLCIGKDALIRLTDDKKANEVDSDKVAAAIKAASAEIDKYVSGRYTVPFADGSVPDLVNSWCCYLSTYFLHRAQTTIPRSVQSNRDLAVKNLRAVMAGEVSIPGAEDLLLDSGLPASTTDGQGHEFINDKYDANGNVTDYGNMGSKGRW